MRTVAARLGGGVRRSPRAGSPGRPLWPVRLVQQDASSRGLARGPQNVVLRPLVAADEAAWKALRLADDARLTPWEATLPAGSGERLPSFRQYVHRQSRAARAGECFPFALEVDSVLAGQVSVGPIHWGSLRQATVGYWIGSPWEGRGIMTLALAMVLDHLLSEGVGLHRVEVSVRPANARSVTVCRRLGLYEEGLRVGLMHINGSWEDHLTFVALADGAARLDGAAGGPAVPGPGFVDRLESEGGVSHRQSSGKRL